MTSCFVYKDIRDLESIGLIHKCQIYQFALAQVECKVNVLLNNCKQNTTLLSLLAGRTVVKGGPFIYLPQPSAQDGENHRDS